MFDVKKITPDEAVALLNEEEGHFVDFVCRDYRGEVVQKKSVAFANADGGDVLIGIRDRKAEGLRGGIYERWEGFKTQEDANQTVADILKNIQPQIGVLTFEFLEIEGYEDHGKVLKVSIEKSPDVHSTAGGNVYVRKGAQCMLLDNSSVAALQLSKGAKSYENQAIEEYDTTRLEQSAELKEFLNYYLPKTDPGEFLKKNYLVVSHEDSPYKATCAGVILYDENPSAALPKKSGLKITRYDTSEKVPERQHLKEQVTIEGPLHKQITQGVREIQKIINSVPIMGSTGMERAKYPPETIKEIMVNALIHRDYNISDDVSIFIFNNRIEIHSPGTLPGYITLENILTQRFSRNPKIVRLLNKYPDRPNYDIGEGLKTAFQKMEEVRLKPPIIIPDANKVIVILPHEPLASPEEQIMQYLETHEEITNKVARDITGIRSEANVQKCFERLKKSKYIELVPGKKAAKSAWKKVGHLTASVKKVSPTIPLL